MTALGAVPQIETERLQLRAHRPTDFDDAFAMWSDPIVTRFIGGKPSSEQQTWSRMLGYAGHWTFMGFGYWAIEARADGRFVGELGFADFRRDVAPAMRGVPELGWALAPAFHGRGYGLEAVRAAVAWGDINLASERTVCMIDEENRRSVRLAENNGYRAFERESFAGRPTIFFERIRA